MIGTLTKTSASVSHTETLKMGEGHLLEEGRGQGRIGWHTLWNKVISGDISVSFGSFLALDRKSMRRAGNQFRLN